MTTEITESTEIFFIRIFYSAISVISVVTSREGWG